MRKIISALLCCLAMFFGIVAFRVSISASALENITTYINNDTTISGTWGRTIPY